MKGVNVISPDFSFSGGRQMPSSGDSLHHSNALADRTEEINRIAAGLRLRGKTASTVRGRGEIIRVVLEYFKERDIHVELSGLTRRQSLFGCGRKCH